jgi:hypothetical protein
MNIKKLRDAQEWSYKKLEPFREERIRALKQFVGTHYSKGNGSETKVPVNLLELAVNTYGQQLAARAPRVVVSSRYDSLAPTGWKLQTGLNYLLKKIDFGDILLDAVQNALFGLGIAKVHMSDEYFYGDENTVVGQPVAKSVSLDDWVHDMVAKSWSEVKFMGSKCRYTEADMRRAGFDPAVVEKLLKAGSGRGGDTSEDERGLSRSGGEEVEYEDTFDVWELFLPKEQKIVFLADSVDEGEPLLVKEWEGPYCGPYHVFRFTRVPGNTMPLPPVDVWIDIHELTNRLFCKLGRQAERQKTVLGYSGGATKDAERIVNSFDGEAIQMDNPGGAKEFSTGGVDQVNLAFVLQLKTLYSYMAGNLDSLGGLSPMAETASQDKMLLEGASKRLASMQKEVIFVTRNIINGLAWYLWTDPLLDLPMVRKIENTSVVIPTRFTAEEKSGEFLDYNIDIEPYSMQDNSPSRKVSSIMQVLQQIIMPSMPILQQQGIGLDMNKLLAKLGEYMDLPELSEILSFQTSEQGGPIGTPPKKMAAAQFTQRTNVRVNRPGATSQGKDAAMIQTLLGSAPQPAEQAQIGRMIG